MEKDFPIRSNRNRCCLKVYSTLFYMKVCAHIVAIYAHIGYGWLTTSRQKTYINRTSGGKLPRNRLCMCSMFVVNRNESVWKTQPGAGKWLFFFSAAAAAAVVTFPLAKRWGERNATALGDFISLRYFHLWQHVWLLGIYTALIVSLSYRYIVYDKPTLSIE